MKHAMMLLVLVLSMALVMPAVAQEGGALAYGESATGAITASAYEQTYTFEGTAGDVVAITMLADDYELDAYLYLLDPEGEIIDEDDDSVGLGSRIIASLPSTGSFTIIATRYDGRAGSSEGSYSLTLQKLELANVGVPFGGEYIPDEVVPVHVFMVPEPGVYTVTFTHIEGEAHPNFEIYQLLEDFPELTVRIDSTKLLGAQLFLELDSNYLYTFNLVQNYYEYGIDTSATYSVVVELSQQ